MSYMFIDNSNNDSVVHTHVSQSASGIS